MEDFIKTLRAQLYERVNSPLLATFVVSWCVWNWRVFLIWVGDAEVSAKLVLVDQYFDGWEKWGVRGAIVPAATTLFYIYVYPWLALPVYRFVQKRQADLQRVRQEFENEKPLSQKEARDLRHALDLAQQNSDALVARKDAQIQAQGNEITSLQKALDEARPRSGTSASTITSNPPLPFPEGAHKVARTVLISKGAEAKEPTEESLRDHYGFTAEGLSQFDREIVARLFDSERKNEFVSASDISPDDSVESLEQFTASLRSLEKRGLIEFENGQLRLTPAGMNVAINFVRNPRL